MFSFALQFSFFNLKWSVNCTKFYSLDLAVICEIKGPWFLLGTNMWEKWMQLAGTGYKTERHWISGLAVATRVPGWAEGKANMSLKLSISDIPGQDTILWHEVGIWRLMLGHEGNGHHEAGVLGAFGPQYGETSVVSPSNPATVWISVLIPLYGWIRLLIKKLF